MALGKQELIYSTLTRLMWPLFCADCTTIKLCKLPLSFPGPELHQTHKNNQFCVSCAHGSATQTQVSPPSEHQQGLLNGHQALGSPKGRGKGRRETEKGERTMWRRRESRWWRDSTLYCTAFTPAQVLFSVPAPACDSELFHCQDRQENIHN